MKVPNLEAMDGATLERFQLDLITLLSLVVHMNHARNHRLSGRIEEARDHECDVERCYHDLPKDWRW